MKIAVSRHVFGSIRGYTTLAKSGDLSPEETAILEVFSFGQTNEPSYLGSLQTEPAYTSRPLHSGRWAVTRVFQGGLDDHNRTTLLFVSAVITIDDWLYSLKCDVNKLLYHPSLWQWNGEEKLEPIEIIVEGRKEAPTPEIRNKVLSLLAAVEKYEREENTTIVVGASDFDAKALRWLNMVLPVTSKQTFSCAARSLNDGLTFSLISMAKEGSFGNSKRRTVNWTPTSTVDNCPYADSLSQFWQPGGEPPWRFIDSCKSFFSIDLAGEPEPVLRKHLLRKKALSTEVEKPKIRHKIHVSRKLAVVLFACAALVCLSTFVIIGAIRLRQSREDISLIKANIREAKNFLSQNSRNKYFPPDKIAAEKNIKKCEDLRYGLEVSLERAKDQGSKAQLKAAIGRLNKWLILARGVQQRYEFLDSLFQQVRGFNLGKSPSIYPVSKQIERVGKLQQSIDKVDKANLAPSYISDKKKTLQNIHRWHEAIGKILQAKQSEFEGLKQSVEQEASLDCYSEEQHKKYDDLSQKLEEIKNSVTLKNAKSSPIPEHLKIAKNMIDGLGSASGLCHDKLNKINNIKKEAVTAFDKADRILGNQNITDGSVKNFEHLSDADSSLKEASSLWPDMPDLKAKQEDLNSKFANNFEKFLGKKKDKVGEIEAQVASGHLEIGEIDELLKALAKVEEIAEESSIPNTDSLIEKLRNLEEETSKLKSNIKLKKNKLAAELEKAYKNIKQLVLDPDYPEIQKLPAPREKEYKIYTKADKHIKKCFEIQKDNLDATRLDKILNDWESVNKETVNWGNALYKARRLTKKLGIYPNLLSEIKELENPQERDYECYKDARRNVDRCLQIKPDTPEAKNLRKGLDWWKKANKLTVDLGVILDSCNKYLQKIEDFDASQKEQLLKEKLPEILRKIEKFKEQIEPKSNRMLEVVIEASQELKEKLSLSLNSAQQEGGEIK